MPLSPADFSPGLERLRHSASWSFRSVDQDRFNLSITAESKLQCNAKPDHRGPAIKAFDMLFTLSAAEGGESTDQIATFCTNSLRLIPRSRSIGDHHLFTASHIALPRTRSQAPHRKISFRWPMHPLQFTRPPGPPITDALRLTPPGRNVGRSSPPQRHCWLYGRFQAAGRASACGWYRR